MTNFDEQNLIKGLEKLKTALADRNKDEYKNHASLTLGRTLKFERNDIFIQTLIKILKELIPTYKSGN